MLFLNTVILYTFTLNKGSHVKNTYRNLIYLALYICFKLVCICVCVCVLYILIFL